MEKVTKKQFASSAVWKILEQFLSKGVTLVVSIVLARLLDASVFGLIALTAVFTNLADILVEQGFTAALISKKDCNDSDYSNSILVSFGTASLLYIATFFLAPVMANYYNEPSLTLILRILGLIFFVQVFAAPRTAVVTRQMKFRLLFICNLVSSIVSGGIGIACAYLGAGPWALVIQRLSQQVLLTVILFIFVKWKFHFKIDTHRMKKLITDTATIVIGLLLNYAGTAIASLVIAKAFSVADLGYYDKGPSLPMQLSLYTFGAITSVLLPTLVSYQGDVVQIKDIVRRIIRVMTYALAPMMIGMMVVSKELVLVLYGEQWLPMVQIMQFSCIYYLATPFMLMNTQVFLALGHTATRIKTEIFRLVLIFGATFGLVFGAKCTVEQLSLANAIIAILAVFFSFYDVYKMLHYTIGEFFSDIIAPLIVCEAMFALIYFFGNFIDQYSFTAHSVVSLLGKVAIGVLVYIFASIAFKLDGYKEIIGVVKSMFGKGKKKELAHE